MTIPTIFSNLKIKQVQSDQITEVKQLVAEIARDVFQLQESVDAIIKKHLDSEDNMQAFYFDNAGTYLVLMDNGVVVGTGALKRIDADTAELKRVFFKAQYHGTGWALRMMQQLFSFALEHKYKKIRLEVFKPDLQARAVAFYNKLGFSEIPAYSDHQAGLSMEKMLNAGTMQELDKLLVSYKF